MTGSSTKAGKDFFHATTQLKQGVQTLKHLLRHKRLCEAACLYWTIRFQLKGLKKSRKHLVQPKSQWLKRYKTVSREADYLLNLFFRYHWRLIINTLIVSVVAKQLMPAIGLNIQLSGPTYH